MPLYTRHVDVSAQTAETNAVEVETEVDEQVITEATVFIDEGANAEVYVSVRDGSRRIMPDAEGDPIRKPGQTGPVPLNHVLPGVPSTVTVKVWSPDADFDHEVLVQWETRPPSEANPVQQLKDLFSNTRVEPGVQGRLE